jgi:hydrogenase maturation factor
MTLRAGKLPQETLAALLGTIAHRDPRVLLGPGIGRDAAVIDMGGETVLVAKMDPITFATDDIGWYAVHVNANDIACMGARPTWFMATALLPVGADDALPDRIFEQLARACLTLGVALVGGHTEVTPGIDHPIIAGAMLGEARRDDIVGTASVEPGDLVLLAGGIAIEGTALLAREAAPALRSAGLDESTLASARNLLYAPGISVVGHASGLTAVLRPRRMHDPTEGGLAGALVELAASAGMTIEIDPSAVPVHPETRAVCDALGLDSWGLLASGALLAIVAASDASALSRSPTPATAPWQIVGRIEPGPPRVIMNTGDSTTPLPAFERDELARYFDEVRAHG